MYTYIILHPISLLLCILTCKYSRYYDLLEMSNSMKNIVDKTLKKKKKLNNVNKLTIGVGEVNVIY